VVSAAAGSVGSIVGQIARIKGCHVVGIAGGKDKCHWLTSELGFDAAVDYKDGATFKALRAAAPKGIDVYFDNVGGDILEACLAQMNNRGRIACCGAISQYDGAPSAHGPRGVPGLIVVKRLIMQGFIVMDYMDQRDKALADLQSWVASGQLKVQEDVIDIEENVVHQRPVRILVGEIDSAGDGTGRVARVICAGRIAMDVHEDVAFDPGIGAVKVQAVVARPVEDVVNHLENRPGARSREGRSDSAEQDGGHRIGARSVIGVRGRGTRAG